MGLITLASCKHDPIIPVQEFSFSMDVMPILSGNCTASGCHGDVNPEEMQLLNYNDVMNGELVVAGNPNASKIMQVILMQSGEKMMPPAPLNRLSDEQVQIINGWILQGALNN